MRRLLSLLMVGLFLLAMPQVMRGDSGANHKLRQPRPIQLGVSGGNVKDKTSQFCCTGTLGSLVKKKRLFTTTNYILSNNHVLARANAGAIGDDIDQPGLVDANPTCAVIAGDIVADLSKFVTINFTSGSTNKVDAAIAKIRSGQVRTDGFILDIGDVSSTTLAPSVNLGVKKSGRTTGLTTGTIAAINVTVNVSYPINCGSTTIKTAQFINQMRITPGAFSAGGDSGSLIVENVSSSPRPVGLLFAGGATDTIANVMTDVLSALGGPTIVGGIAPASAEDNSGALTMDHPDVAAASAVQEQHQDALMRIPGVVGVGIGQAAEDGRVVIEVYLEQSTPELEGAIPQVLDGISVKTVVTGPVTARYCATPSSAE